MPLYTYKCTMMTDCSHEVELLLSLKEVEEGVWCPVCGGKMERIPTVPSPPRGGPTPVFYPNRGN